MFEATREKTVFVWNAMIKALVLVGNCEDAFFHLRRMVSSGVLPDSFTYCCALKACLSNSKWVPLAGRQAREIHAHAVRRGFGSGVHTATTLVDVYGKLGDIRNAQKVFEEMPDRNVVSWSAMIGCYAKGGMDFEALRVFWEMMGECVEPNSVTMVGVLQACGSLMAFEQGRMMHGFVLRQCLDTILPVSNSLISMYAKCGKLDYARRVFYGIGEQKDAVSWNSIISGFGIHGFASQALRLFDEMLLSGIKPTEVSFISILGACSHGGMVEQGKRIFHSMAKDHGIFPSAEHYACLVDLLGRAGKNNEALHVVEDMRIEPGPTVWGSLLGSCRIHGNVEVAEKSCARLFELEPQNAGNYVLLANIYSGAGMWTEVSHLKKLMEAKNLQKLPGCSWIGIKKHFYSFMAVDEANPQMEQLRALILKIVEEMKESTGYVPDTSVVLYDLGQEEKERILLGHSEKLALAFGLINSGHGEVIRIRKNLRICEDCHSVTKFVSKFTKREIFVRDVNRFHHFHDGQCSCGDYW